MKVALLWLMNENSEILISRRAGHMDSDAGVWGPSVSGTVEDNELSHQTVLRETAEELGYELDYDKPIFLYETSFSHPDGKVREFSIYYATISSHAINSFQIEPNEVAEVKWIPISELENMQQTRKNEVIVAHDEDLWGGIFQNLRLISTL